MKTEELVKYLDELLKIKEIEDPLVDGLIVENKGEVNKVTIAVDTSLEAFKSTKDLGANFLFVHHGFLAKEKSIPITGLMYKRVKILLDNDIALYCAHLPLDAHSEFGNNIQAVRLLNAKVKDDFAREGNVAIGKEIIFDPPRKLADLVKEISEKFETKPIVWDFGAPEIKLAAYVSGGGISFLKDAIELKSDVFITGEPRHSAYWLAKESKINCIFPGHYATETLGVKAIGKHLQEKFGLKVNFINLPTGH
ncbi:Nif3-like dinuclear metal center hexameric protein [candidate division WOR-3 bacterium]|nr:Nif3-like dinuclear metal center hexameric protein [candidate division WOR-3 bacterium]